MVRIGRGVFVKELQAKLFSQLLLLGTAWLHDGNSIVVHDGHNGHDGFMHSAFSAKKDELSQIWIAAGRVLLIHHFTLIVLLASVEHVLNFSSPQVQWYCICSIGGN